MLVAVLAACLGPAGADPVPLVPIVSSPIGPVPFAATLGVTPLPGGPVDRGLANAYDAVLRAGDLAARERAAGLYLQARRRAALGDASGALAAAGEAQAAALGAPPVPLAPLSSTVGSGSWINPAAAANLFTGPTALRFTQRPRRARRARSRPARSHAPAAKRRAPAKDR